MNRGRTEQGSSSAVLPMRSLFFGAHVTLRLVVIGLAALAIVFMVTGHKSVTVNGYVLKADYSYSSAFKFLVVANVIVWLGSITGLFLVIAMSYYQDSCPTYYFWLFSHDLFVAVMTIAGFAAATTASILGVDGQQQTGWEPICGHLGEFCHKVTLSVTSCFLVFLCYLVLTVASAYKLKSLI